MAYFALSLVVLVIAFCYWQTLQTVRAVVPKVEQYVERKLALEQERLRPTPDKRVPTGIPQEFLMAAKQESESFAREDALKVYTEMYERLGDWDEVKRYTQLGITLN